MQAENQFYETTAMVKQILQYDYYRDKEKRKMYERLLVDGQNRTNTCDLHRRRNAQMS